jgi:cytochrome c
MTTIEDRPQARPTAIGLLGRAGLAAVAAWLFLVPVVARADGDATLGKKVFAQCMACHRAEEGKNLIGPSLYGVYGRPAASVEGYAYSPAMKNAKVTWDDASLDKYLEAPLQMVRGGKMAFPGLKDKKQRDDVIAYLKTLHK